MSKLGAAASAPWVMRGKYVALAALALIALSDSSDLVAQQQAPSDDELRSMYCVEVIRAEIGLQRHLLSSSDAAVSNATTPALRQQWIDTSSELLQGLTRLEVVRYRLQAYMLPRIAALDSLALAAAVRQGDADFQESRAGADQCAAECNAPQALNQPPPLCDSACSNRAQLSRVSACETPNWLPP